MTFYNSRVKSLYTIFKKKRNRTFAYIGVLGHRSAIPNIFNDSVKNERTKFGVPISGAISFSKLLFFLPATSSP